MNKTAVTNILGRHDLLKLSNNFQRVGGNDAYKILSQPYACFFFLLFFFWGVGGGGEVGGAFVVGDFPLNLHYHRV